ADSFDFAVSIDASCCPFFIAAFSLYNSRFSRAVVSRRQIAVIANRYFAGSFLKGKRNNPQIAYIKSTSPYQRRMYASNKQNSNNQNCRRKENARGMKPFLFSSSRRKE